MIVIPVILSGACEEEKKILTEDVSRCKGSTTSVV